MLKGNRNSTPGIKQFVEEQQEFNATLERFVEEQKETNQLTRLRLNNIEGRLGNLEGHEYERASRTKALARCLMVLSFNRPYLALNQDVHTDSRLMRSLSLAINRGDVAQQRTTDLFETDIIISSEDNRHAVFEVSLTADNDDIHRARARAEILADITGGEVTPAVITTSLNAR